MDLKEALSDPEDMHKERRVHTVLINRTVRRVWVSQNNTSLVKHNKNLNKKLNWHRKCRTLKGKDYSVNVAKLSEHNVLNNSRQNSAEAENAIREP